MRTVGLHRLSPVLQTEGIVKTAMETAMETTMETVGFAGDGGVLGGCFLTVH